MDVALADPIWVGTGQSSIDRSSAKAAVHPSSKAMSASADFADIDGGLTAAAKQTSIWYAGTG